MVPSSAHGAERAPGWPQHVLVLPQPAVMLSPTTTIFPLYSGVVARAVAPASSTKPLNLVGVALSGVVRLDTFASVRSASVTLCRAASSPLAST